jgi:hypothetical protein
MALFKFFHILHFYCYETPDDGHMRLKHVVILCFNILTGNIDI